MVRLTSPRALRNLSADPFTTILYRVDAAHKIAYITLNRPKFHNAFGRTTTLEVDEAFLLAQDDENVRVIVLNGNGRDFCSGHDLGTPLETNDPLVSHAKENGMRGDYERWYSLDLEACSRWRNIRKPVICAAKGFTIYHGAAVMSVADIVIAADDLKYMPSLVEYTTLPWDLHLNARKAKEIFFSQRFVLAEEAFQIGLVNKVVPKDKLDAEVDDLARLIARADPFHLAMMKLSVNQALDTAGMAVDIKNSLSHWGMYRATSKDPGASSVPDGSRQFAPVPAALEEDLMRWSMEAAWAAKNAPLEKRPKPAAPKL